MAAGIILRWAGFAATSGLVLKLLALPALAATDDGEFSYCLETLRHSQFKLTNDPWHISPLPTALDKVEQPILPGDFFSRWTEHKNQNGSTTYVVLRRNINPPELPQDPDDFDVILEQGNSVSLKDPVTASAFAFSATQRHGVNGLLFCDGGDISPLWNWTGSDWHP